MHEFVRRNECDIKATMLCEEEEEEAGAEPMILHYKKGKIVSSLADYGIDVE